MAPPTLGTQTLHSDPPGWADTHDLMTTRAAGLDLGTGDHHRDGAGAWKPSAKCSVKVPREEALGPGQFWGFWLCLVQELARQRCWGLGEGGRVLEPPTQALVPVPRTVSSGEFPCTGGGGNRLWPSHCEMNHCGPVFPWARPSLRGSAPGTGPSPLSPARWH